MKKSILGIMVFGSSILNAGTMGPPAKCDSWNGFYLGANAGGWWTQNNKIYTVGTADFVNPLFPFGAGLIANALADLGTNSISTDPYGFIGGGQVGYNFQIKNLLVMGIEADIDDLTQSNRTTIVNRVIPIVGFPENYQTTLTAKKNINYLGTVRGRLGFLLYPSMLVYGVGGFAYGGVSSNESFTANESLGPAAYSTVFAQNNWNKNLTGWTAGGGVEWMFMSQWSAKIEYAYYDLGVLKSNFVLNQINNALLPPVLWSSANVSSSTRFTVGSVRIGLNYHFA
jgi:outer membrane immunogenic protein